MDTLTREEPKKVLQEMEVHDRWIGHFRSAENEPFYTLAFDFIAREFGPSKSDPVVDAGCGTGKKSLHLAQRSVKRAFVRRSTEIHSTPAGIEFWEQTSSGRFMTRQADIPWLIREFEVHGLKLSQRRAGQFSEIFTMLPWKPLRSAVHVFNNFWFRAVTWVGPSFGNILVLRRPI